jgi:hypothetical protein
MYMKLAHVYLVLVRHRRRGTDLPEPDTKYPEDAQQSQVTAAGFAVINKGHNPDCEENRSRISRPSKPWRMKSGEICHLGCLDKPAYESILQFDHY